MATTIPPVILLQRIFVGLLLATTLSIGAWAVAGRSSWLGLVALALVGLTVVTWLGFSIWAFVHCLRNAELSPSQRRNWLFGIALMGLAAAWLYAARHAGGTL